MATLRCTVLRVRSARRRLWTTFTNSIRELLGCLPEERTVIHCVKVRSIRSQIHITQEHLHSRLVPAVGDLTCSESPGGSVGLNQSYSSDKTRWPITITKQATKPVLMYRQETFPSHRCLKKLNGWNIQTTNSSGKNVATTSEVRAVVILVSSMTANEFLIDWYSTAQKNPEVHYRIRKIPSPDRIPTSWIYSTSHF